MGDRGGEGGTHVDRHLYRDVTEVGDGPDKACCGKELPDGEGPVSKDGGGASCGLDGDEAEKVLERSKSLVEKEEFRNTLPQGEIAAET